jgi:hypothetical protein
MIEKLFNTLLSSRVKEKSEKYILTIAIFSYLVHLAVILLNNQDLLNINNNFLRNPISAIYTPFSFILLYEVYLLIYYIPKSITIYIGKQYEIITLIIIRRIFKDIAYVEMTSKWFQNKNDLQFTFDVFTSIILFYLIYLFYRNIKKREYKTLKSNTSESKNVKKFITLKKLLSVTLVPVLLFLSIYALINWVIISYQNHGDGILEFKKLNNIFYDDFFTILIVVDVLLLLSSFFYSDKFHKIIRNSGFVISTVLIKVSFMSEGIINNLLIISAVLFGYVFLVIHNLFDKNIVEND